jgi:hypothetical protein
MIESNQTSEMPSQLVTLELMIVVKTLGWKSFKARHPRWKRPCPYYIFYSSIFWSPSKLMSQKCQIFHKYDIHITILDSIIIIHKCVFTWLKKD